MIKKTLLFIFAVFIVVIIVATYALNSVSFVRWATDRYAVPQGITYRAITGSVWKGVRVDGLAYRNTPIAQRIVLRWYPIDLLRHTVHIGRIELHGIDVNALQRLIAQGDQNETMHRKPQDSNGSHKPTDLPVHVVVDQITVRTKPFRWRDVNVSRCYANAGRLRLSADALHVRSVGLDAETSLGTLRLKGSVGRQIVVKRLQLLDLDIDRIKATLAALPSQHHTTSPKTDDKTDGWPSFVPQRLKLFAVEATILPFVFDPVRLREVNVTVRDATVDLKTLRVEQGTTELSLRSDLADIDHNGTIRNRRLVGDVRIVPRQALFKRYNVPLRAASIGVVPLHAIVDDKGVDAVLRVDRLRDPFEGNASAPLSIRSLELSTTVSWKGMRTQAHAKLNASLPQAPTIHAQATLRYDTNATYYEANASVPRFRLSDANLSTLLHDMRVHVQGVNRRMRVRIDNPYLKGAMKLDANGSGTVRLQTRDKVYLKTVAALQAPFERAWVDFRIDAPFSLRKPLPLDANVSIISNLVDIKGKVRYGKHTRVTARATLSDKSLLPEFDPKVHWNRLFPLKLEAQEENKTARIAIQGAALRATGKADVRSGDVQGTIKLQGLSLDAVGNVRSAVRFDSEVDSFVRLRRGLGNYYDIQALPDIKGSLHLSLVVSPKGDSFAVLRSPHLSYRADRKSVYTLNDVDIVARKADDRIILDAYRFVLNDKVLFASKPSSAKSEGSRIVLDAFWINDTLKLFGDLDLKTMRGKVTAKADRFAYRDENVDLNASVDIQARFNGATTDIEGEIGLLDTHVLYDLGAKRFPNDSDIIIVQDRSDANQSDFMQGLSLNVRIVSKKPIVYRQGPIDLQADAELTLFKVPGDEVLLLGNIILLDDGSYRFQGKRFVIKKSTIYFTGRPSEPILDIKAQYKAMHYVVTIQVTGTPTIPNIIFSSAPHLTREQILSLILFDSVDAAEGGDANTMMKMMGGAMAKAALSDLGVSIDHLVVGSGSVEVGKKISEKTTVIYIDGDIPKVQLKYEYSPHVEIIVGASERSESIDVVYKKDFSSKDIIIRRKTKKKRKR